ncbi:hypothetical protein [Brevibacillus sp. NRS-1366]|uniref:hypothetical protein n=1 Tax=Brevibacillus sp. NRS-1366 TaxID=3233899 RepID=UPI003D20C489
MIIYLVSGAVVIDEYQEKVVVLEDMEEKPKSYVGNGKRIDKNKIGLIEQGMHYDEYRIALLDKESIQDAREKIKKMVLKYHQGQLENYQKSVKAVINHDLTSEIKFR